MSPEYDFYPPQNRNLETKFKKFGWVKLQESQTLIQPRPKNPKRLKLVIFVNSLYIKIGEGLRAENFTNKR